MNSENTIRELEDEYGIDLDGNFDTDAYLCHGNHCHEACSCWKDLEAAVREQLEKQQAEQNAEMQRMEQLYNAEVHYGIHVPRGIQ